MKGILKFGVAASLVGGVCWSIITFYPSVKRGHVELVRESQADIFAMSFGAPSNTEKFGGALERLGHEPPRVYRANENALFFSTTQFLNKRPNEVLREYQEEFVRQGLNARVYTTPVSNLARQNTPEASAEINELQDAAMAGEVIPYMVDNDSMSMGGTVMDLDVGDQNSEKFASIVTRLESNVAMASRAYEACGGSAELLASKRGAQTAVSTLADRVDRAAAKAQSCSATGGFCSDTQERYQKASGVMSALKAAVDAQPELRQCAMMKNAARAGVDDHKDEFAERVKAFRSIEAVYDARANVTHVSATWSDEKFDATKFRKTMTGNLDETKVAQSLPLCDGCRRTWDFGGSGKESDYSTTQINSPNSVSLVSEYYVRKLEQEGWKVTESQRVSDELMRLSNETQDSRWLRVARGDEHMTVRISNDKRGGSRIVATTAN